MNLYQSYPAYFENLATHHIAIQHSASDVRFFAMNLEDLIYGAKTMSASFIVVLEDFEGKYEDKGSDNIRDNQEVHFYILRKADLNNIPDQNTAADECKTIAEDFISAIRKDYISHRDAIQKNGLIQDFHPESIDYMKVGPLFTNYYGVRFGFSNGQKKSLRYDSNKWI